MINQTLFDFIRQFSGHYLFFDRLIVFGAAVFPWLVIIVFFSWIFWRLVRDRDPHFFGRVLLIVTVSLLSWFLAQVIKNFWTLPRPFETLAFHPLMEAGGGSFPSGHAAFFSGLGFAAYRVWRRTGSWLLIAALLIGLARIAAGVHWPLDILGGFILGGAMTVLLAIVAGLPPERDI